MDSVKRYRLLILVSLAVFMVSVISGCTNETQSLTQEPVNTSNAKEIAVVFEITNLHPDTLDPKNVSSEFIAALKRTVPMRGFKLVPAIGEDDIFARGLNRAIFIRYDEKSFDEFQRDGRVYRGAWDKLNAIPGTEINVTLQGWDNKSGRGVLFSLSGRTPPYSDASAKIKDKQLLELRQNTWNSFWQEFPDELPQLFLDDVPSAQTKWQFQPELKYSTSNFDYNPQFVGNMFFIYSQSFLDENHVDDHHLNIIDTRSGQTLKEFKAATFIANSDSIFIQSMDKVYMVDAITGEGIWEHPGNFLAVEGEEVYLTEHLRQSEKPRLIKLNRNKGSLIWETGWGQGEIGKPVVAKDTVIVELLIDAEAGEYEIYALDRDSGKIIWGPKEANYTNLQLLSDNRVGLQSYEAGKLIFRAFDARTGEDLWKSEITSNEAILENIIVENGMLFEFRHTDEWEYWFYTHGGLAGAGGKSVYVPDPKLGPGWYTTQPGLAPIGIDFDDKTPYFLARDINTGTIIWQKPMSDEESTPVEGVQRPITRTYALEHGLKAGLWWELSPNGLVATDFLTGKAKWEYPIEQFDSAKSRFLIDNNDKVLVMGLYGSVPYGKSRVVALDARNGTELWHFDVPLREYDPYELLAFDDNGVLIRKTITASSISSGEEIKLLDKDSGKVKWEKTINGDFRQMKSGIILFSGGGGVASENYFTLNANTGEEKCNLHLPSFSYYNSGAVESALNAPNKTLFWWARSGASDGSQFLLAYDLNNGKLKWTCKVPMGTILNDENGNIYLWTPSGSMRLISLKEQ